jgi:2-amino-4-hydroxy-6-hydroxymethyldihydropteridine diphosphokinase
MDKQIEHNSLVYLSLGSNIGDKIKNLEQAVKSVALLDGVKLKHISSYYQTEPWGNENQDFFINQCISIDTTLLSDELMLNLLAIESQLGRIRTEKYNPRIIDIDILLYKNQIIESDVVTIPHPRLHERNFVLHPLVEIGENVIHPNLKLSISEILQQTKDDKEIIKLK